MGALADDPQVMLVRVGDEKQRLRQSYDAAALSGGYRDVQLTAMLDTPETRVNLVLYAALVSLTPGIVTSKWNEPTKVSVESTVAIG